MAVTRVPLIAGNWKMNLDHLQAISVLQKLAWALDDVKHDFAAVEVAVFPPFTDLRSVQTLIAADKLQLKLGAQDVSVHPPGAHTGEVAAEFLARLEAQYVIVGHSERRTAHHETDDIVAAKAKRALEHGLVPIVCVGESANDLEDNAAGAVAVRQLEAVLTELSAEAELVIAYEPVWAIGSGEPASPDDAQSVAALLREAVHSNLGDDAATRTRILYGGSVTSTNVATYLRQPDVDGVLVGGASLDPAEFTRIVQFQKHVTR